MMRSILQRGILASAISPLVWFPWNLLRPGSRQALPRWLVLLQALTGFLAGGVALYAVMVAGFGVQDPEFFLIGGTVGALARGAWFRTMRKVWNRQVEQGGIPAGIETTAGGALLTVALRGLILAAAVLAVVQVENLRGWLTLREAQAEVRKNGVPLEVAEIVPPPVPDDQNLALYPPLRALTELEDGWDVSTIAPAPVRWRAPAAWQRSQELFPIEDRSHQRSLRSFALAQLRERKGAPAGETASDEGGDLARGTRLRLEYFQAYYRWLTNWPAPERPGSPGRDVLLALSGSDRDLAALRAAAAERPLARHALAYERGNRMLFGHLGALLRWSLHLRLRAQAHLAEGESAEALDDLLLAFRLADSVTTEPFLMSQWVRHSMTLPLLQTVGEGLTDGRWDAAQLEALQETLERNSDPEALVRAIRGELVLARSAYQRRDMMFPGAAETEENEAQAPMRWLRRWAPWGWIQRNEACHLRSVAGLVRRVTAAGSLADLQRVSELDNIVDQPPRLDTFLARQWLPARDYRQAFTAEAWRRLAITALRLERHRLSHGEYPASLAELQGDPRSVTTLDPMDGRLLRYQRRGDGTYTLHSVGPDLRDQDGARPRAQATALDHDLVWR